MARMINLHLQSEDLHEEYVYTYVCVRVDVSHSFHKAFGQLTTNRNPINEKQ